MTRGRRPLPTAIKAAKGTLQKCRTTKNEMKPQLVDQLPEPPAILGERGKSEWDAVCRQLHAVGLLATCDLSLLTTYCIEMENYFDAEEQLRANGRVIKSPSGYPMPHPYVPIARNALKAAREIGVLFGLTPSARTKIPTKQEEPEEDELTKLIRMSA